MEEETAPSRVERPVHNIEAERHRNAMELTALNHRMEAVRLAQQVLLENARNRPAGERNVTADEIEAFALQLIKLVGE